MKHIVLVPPAHFTAPVLRRRHANLGTRARPLRRSLSRLGPSVALAAGLAVTAASYGVSLAWLLWYVRASGDAWMQHLLGRVG